MVRDILVAIRDKFGMEELNYLYAKLPKMVNSHIVAEHQVKSFIERHLEFPALMKDINKEFKNISKRAKK